MNIKPGYVFISMLMMFVTKHVWGGQINVDTILPLTQVDAQGDLNVFTTPFDYQQGYVVTVHVESPDKSGTPGMNLRTVVRKGIQDVNGQWKWEATTLEKRTIVDPWHTQASIAFDKQGYVHVVYNMHNMPWQYSVSEKPYDISRFTFRGQALTAAEIAAVKLSNSSSFPSMGLAAIPGNQVTYPMFFKDKKDDLYVTYRYALKPARPWDQRSFAGGMAKYDTTTKTWTPIGGIYEISRADALISSKASSAMQYPFVFEGAFSPYLINLVFDKDNSMHAFWSWRSGGAGETMMSPSYAYSPDGNSFYKSNGQRYNLPIGFASSDFLSPSNKTNGFYAPKSAAILADGSPAVVVQPVLGGRQLISLDKSAKAWRSPETMPSSASEIIVDKVGQLWALGSGLRVFKRRTSKGQWESMGEIGNSLCYPKVKYIPAESRFIVHAKSCDGSQATILSFVQ